MLFYGNAEHLGSGGAVNVLSFCEYLGAPFFSGDVGEDTGFDGGVIADDEFVSRTWNEGSADQLGEGIRDVAVEKLHGFIIPRADQGSGLGEIRHVVLGKVLQLDQAAGPSAGAIGTVELEHAVSASVRAHGILHGLVFLDGGLGKLQTEAQGIGDISVCVVWRFLDEPGNFLFAERVHFQSLGGEPVFHLGHAVGVV